MKIEYAPGTRKKPKAYCGQENGHWYLSKFDASVPGRPKNQYETREAAVAHAESRNLDVVMEGV